MEKKCFKCTKIKLIEEFYAHHGTKDGHLNKCIECTKLDSSIRYYNIPIEKHRADRRNYDNKNRDKKSKWSLKYIKNNPGKVNAQTAKRRTIKLQATPQWLTKEQYNEIKQFYIDAKDLQWLSEERLEVDHIVPLVSDIVCGLHVPWNLQILPKSQNVKKGNKI